MRAELVSYHCSGVNSGLPLSLAVIPASIWRAASASGPFIICCTASKSSPSASDRASNRLCVKLLDTNSSWSRTSSGIDPAAKDSCTRYRWLCIASEAMSRATTSGEF